MKKWKKTRKTGKNKMYMRKISVGQGRGTAKQREFSTFFRSFPHFSGVFHIFPEYTDIRVSTITLYTSIFPSVLQYYTEILPPIIRKCKTFVSF
jgi:hypothetical protein